MSLSATGHGCREKAKRGAVVLETHVDHEGVIANLHQQFLSAYTRTYYYAGIIYQGTAGLLPVLVRVKVESHLLAYFTLLRT